MSNKMGSFFKDFGGFIIGALLGILIVACGILDFILAILVVLIFGMFGMYIQKNKSKIKEVLKNLIERW